MNAHKLMTRALLLWLACLLAACSPITRSWRGKVVEVRSGDTLTVLQGRRQVMVLLHAVGTHTVRRPAGRSAKRLVSRLVLGREVIVREINRDRKGRSFAVVKLGSLDLRRLLLYQGLGWHIVQYDHSPELRSLERDAQRAKRGVWAGM